jgi:chromosome segregation ATPase
MDQGDLNNMEEEKKNARELAVFEEIRKSSMVTAEDAEKMKVPMAMVFGHGTTGNLPSFGNKTLNENSQLVDAALKNVGELGNIWNHSHTQWMWKHINFSYHSPHKNMRQISAELSKKKSALTEAKWRHIKKEAKIRKLQEELGESENLDYWREVDLKIKLAELQEGAIEGMTYIEGAMKDVLALQEIYEDLKEKVSGFSEHDIEREESITHLKRSIVQCIRDVRQSGKITKGEQEYMEQIGVNPSKMQRIIQEYVKKEVEQDSWGSEGLFEFVDGLAHELIDKHKVDVTRMELLGYDPEPNEAISFSNKVALLGNFGSEENNEE